jgi:hypothetical protein
MDTSGVDVPWVLDRLTEYIRETELEGVVNTA